MDYRQYLPSTHFVFIVGSIAAAGLIIYAASFLGKGKPLTQMVTLGEGNSVQNINLTDSDGDGLPDWEEAVRGTDPHKADTDNDGTSDGDEVKMGRNPTKMGPGDELVSEENRRLIQELTAAASSTNMTDTISRTLFAQYLSARMEGESANISTQQNMVDNLIAKATVGLKGKTYGMKDLTLTKDDTASMHVFADASALAIRKHPNANFRNTIEALALAIDAEDPVAIARLKAIGKEYRALAKDLAAVPVPSNSAATYLKGINAIENSGASFEDIGYVVEDPVRAVAGIKNYNAMLTVGAQAFVMISHDIIVSKVQFADKEPGADWYTFVAPLADNAQTI